MTNQREKKAPIVEERYYCALGPQFEPLFCRSAEEARDIESRNLEARKRRAKSADEAAKCPACGRPVVDDDDEELTEEEGDTRG